MHQTKKLWNAWDKNWKNLIRKIDKSTIKFWGNSPLLVIIITNTHQQNIEEWNDTISQPDLTDISTTPFTCSRKHLLSSIHRIFTKIKYLLSHKELKTYKVCSGLLWWPDDKEFTCNAGDLGSTPGSGKSPGEGNGTHSNILAWRSPRTEEPGGP